MKIKSAFIQNFRCFKELRESQLAPMTTIIGKNDVGKSTLLMAIDVFFNAKQVQQSDFFKDITDDPIVIRLTFDGLSRDLETKVSNYLSPEGNLVIEKHFQFGARPEEFYYKEDFTDSTLREIENKGQEELSRLVDDLKAVVIKTGVRPTNEDKRRAVINVLESRNEPRGFFPVRPAAEAKAFIENEMPSFNLYPADSNLSTGQASFQSYFAPIVKVILDEEKETFDKIENKIKIKLDENVRALTAIVKQHNDSVRDLHMSTRYQWDGGIRHELEIVDVLNHPQLFQQRGFGLRRTIMLAVFRLLQNLIVENAEATTSVPFKQILCIEEPEIYLHPGAQRQLYHSFHSLSTGGIQIIITTHSTVFVDRTVAGNVLLLQRNSNAETEPHTISDKSQFEILRQDLGIRSSDVFFANCILLVEGETEEIAFPALFETLAGKSFDEYGVKVINLRGKTKSPEFLKAINEMNMPKVLIVDRDAETDGTRAEAHKPSNLKQEGLIAEADCFTLELGEFEDEIPSTLLCRALQQAYPNYGEIDEQWLMQLKVQCSVDQKKLTAELNRHLYSTADRKDRYDKVRVGRFIGEVAIRDEIPDSIRNCFNRIIELSK